MPFNSGMLLIDGHRLPQADPYGQPPRFLEASQVHTGPVAVPSRGAAPRPSPSPLAHKGKPMVPGGHQLARVLLGTSSRKGRPPAVCASGENPWRGGIVECLFGCSGECKDVEGRSW